MLQPPSTLPTQGLPSTSRLKEIDPQLAGALDVIERAGSLAYCFELHSSMRINNVISVACLEHAIDPVVDLCLELSPVPTACRG